jgi:site-specific DNA-cytosine methylase
MKLKKDVVNRNKAVIAMRLGNLSSNEYVRARQLTPREVLKFMGVDDIYVKRMLSPYEELGKNGYSRREINELMTVDGKRICLSNRCLYQRAGNAIVVNVLYYMFENLLVPPEARINRKQ